MCQWGPQIVHTQPEWAEGDHAFGTVGRDMGGVGTIGTRSRGVLYTEPDPRPFGPTSRPDLSPPACSGLVL